MIHAKKLHIALQINCYCKVMIRVYFNAFHFFEFIILKIKLFVHSCLCNSLVFCLFIQEVGMPADYVNKLARMFQDIKVSEDLNQAFKEMHKNNKLALPGIVFKLFAIFHFS